MTKEEFKKRKKQAKIVKYIGKALKKLPKGKATISDSSIVELKGGKLFAKAAGKAKVTFQDGEKVTELLINVSKSKATKILGPLNNIFISSLPRRIATIAVASVVVAGGVVTPVTIVAVNNSNHETSESTSSSSSSSTSTSTSSSTSSSESSSTTSSSQEVVHVTGVSISETEKVVTEYDEFTLSETVLPENASNKKVKWSSSAPDVVKVINGYCTALTSGEATITVKTEDGNFDASCEVSVNPFDRTLEPVKLENISDIDATLTYTKGYDSDVTLVYAFGADYQEFESTTITIPSKSTVYVKAREAGTKTGGMQLTIETDDLPIVTDDAEVVLSGNISSLIYSDQIPEGVDPREDPDPGFMQLFQGSDALVEVKDGLFTTKTAADYSYAYMFTGCENLRTVGHNLLPATNLGEGCYMGMFSGCYALETAPYLPATKLNKYSYYYMFEKCKSLQLAKSGEESKKIFTCPSYEAYSYAVNGMFDAIPDWEDTTPVVGSSYYFK